jgi:putative transposase
VAGPAAGCGLPVIFIDALMVKIRDGVVASRPVYLAIGVDCEDAKQVLGLWVGPTTGESAKFRLTVLSELKGHGVADVCIVCCDCEDDRAPSRAAA